MDGGRLYIVGCGPGARDMLTIRARNVIEQATVCVGAERLLEELVEDKARIKLLPLKGNYEEVLERAELFWRKGERVVFLVSGDPLLYSLGTRIIERFGRDSCEVIPGISSVQYAFARLGEDWHNLRIISLHGRRGDTDIKRVFEEEERVAILLDGRDSLRLLGEELRGVELSGYVFHLAVNLSLPDERVVEIRPQKFHTLDVPSLSILIARRRV